MISDESFPKEEHLLKTRDYRNVYKKGKAVFAGDGKRDALILYSLLNGLEKNRFGLSVSSRSIKLATRRNRFKRILREVYRRTKGELKKGYDMVMIVKKDTAKPVSYTAAKALFLELARKSGLLS